MERGPAPHSSGDKTPVRIVARLTTRSQFLFVRGGVNVRKKGLVVQARIRRQHDQARITPEQIGVGFTATKKIGNAVVRNRAKRRLRASAQRLLPKLGRAGVDYVFIARQRTGLIEWSSLLDDMESALVSLGARFAEEQSAAS